jgi:hypothetical protein
MIGGEMSARNNQTQINSARVGGLDFKANFQTPFKTQTRRRDTQRPRPQFLFSYLGRYYSAAHLRRTLLICLHHLRAQGDVNPMGLLVHDRH